MARRAGDRPAQRRVSDRGPAVDGAHVAPLGRVPRRAPPARDRRGARDREGHRSHHGVPTSATGGDGDVAVSPDGREIAVAMHGDDVVATNTNVDIYLIAGDEA